MTLEDVSRRIIGDSTKLRREAGKNDIDQVLGKLAKLPRFFMRVVMAVFRFLDFHDKMPAFICEGDPNYSTVLMTNLGSIGCSSVYHHLNNYGTNSLLIAIGTVHKARIIRDDGETQIRDVVDLGVTLDERIADGFYFARSVKLLEKILSLNALAMQTGAAGDCIITGVPTLFEALLRNKSMKDIDLSCLEGVFSGGDSLSIELKRKVDRFLREHHAPVQIREGYGTTECVTASCLTPKDFYKEGSIGIPFPDTYYKIVKASTKMEIPYGDEGEICISGPTVMKGYLDNPEETESTLQRHGDGRIWLHTGDLGTMDEEGVVYYKQRLKRMIISSGYSIYPSQLENIIDANKYVLMCTVIGVPDPYKVQKVKAFIVLKRGVKPTPEVQRDIEAHCAKNIAKYAMPYEFEYRDKLPQTLVRKVAYTVLEKEELAKLNKLES